MTAENGAANPPQRPERSRTQPEPASQSKAAQAPATQAPATQAPAKQTAARSPGKQAAAKQPSASQGNDSQIPYEQARDQLTDVVKRLEAGGLTLEQSLELWERGEQLAAICEEWLEGARARLTAAMATRAAPPDPNAPF